MVSEAIKSFKPDRIAGSGDSKMQKVRNKFRDFSKGNTVQKKRNLEALNFRGNYFRLFQSKVSLRALFDDVIGMTHRF